jgi:outer membrane protein assembly factor BamA
LKNSHRASLTKTMTFSGQSYLVLSVLLLLSILVSASRAYGQPQQPPAKTIRLSSLEVTGLQSVTKEQVIAVSGLQVGEQITIEMLDAAAQKLANSGLFTNLSYRLSGSADKAIVTFEVEELKARGLPVVFDNFVWFSEEEVFSAVRRELPTFNGTAPESSSVLGQITKALQQLLQERKIQGQIEYNPSANLGGGNAKHVFSVKGASAKICAVQFPGTKSVEESELVRNSKPLMGGEYSQEFVSAFAVANLIPVYRERGHLRAYFSSPSAKVGTDSGEGCKDAVIITLPVNEGVAYSWDKAEWSGNDSYTAQELETALSMKAGELANGLKLDAGVKAVEKTYGKRGFLRARVETEPTFDDVNKRVAYRVIVKEGPQFRMGTLKITGLPADEALRLKHRWKLREKDVYDDSYVEEFNKKEVTDVISSALREGSLKPGTRLKLDTSVKPNNQTLMVDVELNFKNPASEPAAQ